MLGKDGVGRLRGNYLKPSGGLCCRDEQNSFRFFILRERKAEQILETARTETTLTEAGTVA
jgi:hypothetical protein